MSIFFGSTTFSAAAVMTRVFMTSAGQVVMEASAPARAPRARVSQGANSLPLPPKECPVPCQHAVSGPCLSKIAYLWMLHQSLCPFLELPDILLAEVTDSLAFDWWRLVLYLHELS